MSIKIMTQVWDNPEPRGVPRWVLLCIADYCNDAGVCWPSIASIAKRTRITQNSTRKAIRALEDSGYLTTERRRIGERLNDTSLYHITLPLPTVPAKITVPLKSAVPTKKHRSTPKKASRVPAKLGGDPSVNREEPSGAAPDLAPTDADILTAIQAGLKRRPNKNDEKDVAAMFRTARPSVDLALIEATCKAWRMRGFKLVNYSGMADVYAKDGDFSRPSGASGAPGKSTRATAGQAARKYVWTEEPK